jgi:hypothetical protein
MSSTYLDCFGYQRQPTGLIVQNYLGNSGRLALPCIASAVKLTTPPLTVALNAYDALYLFDGPNSESVQIGASGDAVGDTALTLQAPTQYAHAAGTPYCTDGTSGSLGAQLFTASQWIEDICFQALWAVPYAGEILTMPTMRAALDNRGYFHFRPRHFPITALSSVAIQTASANAVSYDPAQAIIDSDQQTVDIPASAVLATQSPTPPQISPWNTAAVNRRSTGWISINYTSGFAVNALPWPVQRACTLLVSECFGQLENPMGADSIQQNKRKVDFVVRGDTSGETLLVKQAKQLLAKYIAQSF